MYWAAALIHEFAIKDLYKPRICATPNIIKSLQVVLSASESILQRIVLRIISFLCVGNQSFRSTVLHCASLVARLPVCFASGDKDVVHWAVVLLHDLLLSAGIVYRRIPKVTPPLLSDLAGQRGRYFRVAVTFE